MKVLITGGTGLIGREIVSLCHKEDIVVNYLTTSKEKIKNESNYKGFYWNPQKGEIDKEALKDVEVIINLAGATIAKRWTRSYRQEILESRVQALATLYKGLKETKHQVRQLISASAVGIYKDSFQNYCEEKDTIYGDDFLSEVVQQWEQSAFEFKTIGIEVAVLRIGLVLSPHGGVLPTIVKPIKYGLGAIFGTGKQWQSWIHIKDLAKMIMYVLHEELEGVYNAVAPNPVSNKKMTQLIAEYYNKQLWLPNIPKNTMRLLLGKMHILLFSSQRVCSEKIQERGFNYTFENLKPALIDLLKEEQ